MPIENPLENNYAFFSYVRASRFVKEFTQIAQSAIKGPWRKEGEDEQSAHVCEQYNHSDRGKFQMIPKRSSHRIEQ